MRRNVNAYETRGCLPHRDCLPQILKNVPILKVLRNRRSLSSQACYSVDEFLEFDRETAQPADIPEAEVAIRLPYEWD